MPPTSASNKPKNGSKEHDHLTKRDEIDILLTEYNRLSTQARMYVEQLSPKFGISAVFVLSAFAFALQDESHRFVFLIIPPFIFLLTSITAAQFYLVSVLAGRIREIERRIETLNGGKAILKWETEVATRYVYSSLVRVRLKGKRRKRLRILNPQVLAVIFTAIACIPLVYYPTKESYSILPKPWNIVYVIVSSLSSIVLIASAFSFFRIDMNFDDIEKQNGS